MDTVEASAVGVGTVSPGGATVVAGGPVAPPEPPSSAGTLPRDPETPWAAPTWFVRLLVVGAVAAVAVGLVLRFWTRSDMWLDEALTFDIARLPVDQIPGALKRDGAPPLYYVMLHFWIMAVGTSNVAVRALSGVLSCATLPFVWIAGRRIGGRTVAIGAVVLVATSPFAVQYATENRMYSLVALLTAAGLVALQRALERPAVGNLIGVAVSVSLLLYSQYWSLYLIGVTALCLAWQAWRGLQSRRRGARAALAALAVGCATFLPWVPTFVFQSRHTGTPWAIPADFAALVNAVTSFAGGATNQGRALALLYFALAGLGLFGVAGGIRHIVLDLRTRPDGRGLAIVTVGTLTVAVICGYISRSAFQARYASVIFVLLTLLVAMGFATFTDLRIRAGVMAATVVFGIAGSLPNVWTSRTQAGQVSAALARYGHTGDIVAYCPDQLGPSVYHLLPAGRYRQITFPRETGPQYVNWIDYAQATAAGDPARFVSRLESLSRSTHDIWYVWAPGYETLHTKCEQIENDLLADQSLRAHEIFPFTQVLNSSVIYEDMELVQFVPVPG
ncbi:MAG TPA: glycosyltransferase family 39 protein [Acidimicrobiales bacterium]|nr:glycosyltransferase family 39 protein [Acidimicrobiales bacterium]